ncbi:sulfotransferase family protein [Saccharopolyspora indica]|uniref:sulfotransferase-like domain-containing protein n=1 Tax=Saccharopolyspora indica TaxID=1229659 RepID=UPI0022EA7679|nr:sulfotransferase family protein [Saccharopolyspora indica]MDA3648000.1 sulfotransferase family protein [Saccharopolyspora indica]
METPLTGPRVLALWSAPRARSTAFFRSMVERDEFTALHEPFCNLVDFGATAVGEAEVRTGPELIAAIRAHARTRPVFLKDTTDYRYPEVLADEAFLRETRHAFLIRHPDEIAASYYALKPDMTRDGIGLEQMSELHRAVLAAGGRAAVLDAEDLAAHPEATLAAYCAWAGIEHRPETLSWQPGARPEWERSDRWHRSVANSSGFDARRTEYADTVGNNPRLAEFSAHHLPFYEALREQRLTVPVA